MKWKEKEIIIENKINNENEIGIESKKRIKIERSIVNETIENEMVIESKKRIKNAFLI